MLSSQFKVLQGFLKRFIVHIHLKHIFTKLMKKVIISDSTPYGKNSSPYTFFKIYIKSIGRVFFRQTLSTYLDGGLYI